VDGRKGGGEKGSWVLGRRESPHSRKEKGRKAKMGGTEEMGARRRGTEEVGFP